MLRSPEAPTQDQVVNALLTMVNDQVSLVPYNSILYEDSIRDCLIDDGAHGVNEVIGSLFDEAALRAGEVAYGLRGVRNSRPRSHYGKALQRALALPNLHINDCSPTCIEAEPRLLRSLDYHRPGSQQEGALGPAVIFLDEDERPIGYQKDCGVQSTYFWNAVEVETASGVQAVPADSFGCVEFNCDENLAKHYAHMGLGIIAVSANSEFIYQLGFARLAGASLLEPVRHAMAYAAANIVPKLHENIPQPAITDRKRSLVSS